MTTFVLVPGAWLGSWCWRDVAARLLGEGHDVAAVTLTGLSERAHLLTRQTGLRSHIDDIVTLIERSDLKDVVLVGHSYGGTVITAAAERTASRIRMLVYVDGSVPRDGQSNNDVVGPDLAARLRQDAVSHGDGWLVLPAPATNWGLTNAMLDWVTPQLTPHPLLSFEEPVRLQSRVAAALPRAFLRSSPNSVLYARLMEQARHARWRCGDIDGGHYPMFTNPEAVASALVELEGKAA